MADECWPKLGSPLLKIVFSSVVFCIAALHVTQTLGSQLLEAFIKLLAHLVVLLVACVTEAEYGEVHPSERLIFASQKALEPAVECFRVIAGIAFVVSCNTDHHEFVRLELFLLEIVEIVDF